MTVAEIQELKDLEAKDEAGTLTKEDGERLDVLFQKFMKEMLYMGDPNS